MVTNCCATTQNLAIVSRNISDGHITATTNHHHPAISSFAIAQNDGIAPTTDNDNSVRMTLHTNGLSRFLNGKSTVQLAIEGCSTLIADLDRILLHKASSAGDKFTAHENDLFNYIFETPEIVSKITDNKGFFKWDLVAYHWKLFSRKALSSNQSLKLFERSSSTLKEKHKTKKRVIASVS